MLDCGAPWSLFDTMNPASDVVWMIGRSRVTLKTVWPEVKKKEGESADQGSSPPLIGIRNTSGVGPRDATPRWICLLQQRLSSSTGEGSDAIRLLMLLGNLRCMSCCWTLAQPRPPQWCPMLQIRVTARTITAARLRLRRKNWLKR